MKKILLTILIYFLYFNSSKALIEIDITRGNLDPLPIAVSQLYTEMLNLKKFEGLKVKELGADISKIIEENFKNTII